MNRCSCNLAKFRRYTRPCTLHVAPRTAVAIPINLAGHPRNPDDRPPQLPHHRLVAYHVAVELLLAIRDAKIRDAKLRDQALRAATSVACNIAEGAGRVTRADKARAFAVRGRSIRRTGGRGVCGRGGRGARAAVFADRSAALRAAHRTAGVQAFGAGARCVVQGAGGSPAPAPRRLDTR